MSVQALSAVFEHSTAKGSARLVLLSIANHVNDEGIAYAGIQTYVREGRISERAARDAVRQLESLGEIEAVGVHPQYRTTLYALRVGQFLQGQMLPHGANGGAKSAPEPKAAVGVTALSSGSSPTGPRSAQRFSDAEFEAFWAAYPIRKGKAAAKRAFGKALKKAGSLDVLVEGARRYAADPNRDPLATKYAQGWLNDERWLDEDSEDASSQALRLLRERGTA